MSEYEQYRKRDFDALCEQVKDFTRWYVMESRGNFYFCFELPDGNQRFCRNMPPKYQKQLGIYGGGENVCWRDAKGDDDE